VRSRLRFADVSEGPIPEAPDLIQRAVKRFESYAAAREIRIQKQSLLATLDPVARLTRVDALMDLSALPFSPTLGVTRRRALDYANQRKHQYATLEHLLLALIDDADAAAVMGVCNADLGALRTSLVRYLDNELKNLAIENGGDAKPTAAFHRVAERAALHAQELGRPVVTGANTLLAIFPETRSLAARLLGEQGVSRGRAADIIVHGVGKGT
jgi:ATP-dependent Lon protease